MKKIIADILSTGICYFIILFTQDEILLINIIFFIAFSFCVKNFFSITSIIPLFFSNPNTFIILTIFVGAMLILSIFNVKEIYYSLLSFILTITTLYFLGESFPLIVKILTIIILIAIYLLLIFKRKELKTAPYELFYLVFFILNSYFSWYFLIALFVISLVQIRLIDNNSYYHFTSFFICAYLIYIQNNLYLITIQILAYLNHLLDFSKSINPLDSINYLLEDINNNISNFCSFLNDFNHNSYAKEYEENLGKAIKIIIESFCASCKNKGYCYTGLKLKTYSYIIGLLTDSKTATDGFFTCLYYQGMREKAQTISTHYNIKTKPNAIMYKIDGISASLQNYFVHIFSIISPEMLKITNFKGLIKENKIKYTSYSYDIDNKDAFSINVKCDKKQIKKLEQLSLNYFKRPLCLNYENGMAKIFPPKKYKIIYDYATMSSKAEALSGDNFLFYDDIHSSFVAALSDGMGSGYSAYKISKEALRLISQIIECKIDFETSLQIITNMYKLKASSDIYATLDLININLFSGEINIFKLGSTTTFLIRNNKPLAIYNSNLPFGINDLVTKEKYLLNADDYVIMVSDGVTDYLNERILLNYLENINNFSPHKIVYDIMQLVSQQNKMSFMDDTSCAVIKILKQ